MDEQEDKADGSLGINSVSPLEYNIWQTPGPDQIPTKWLKSWRIYKVTKAVNMPERFGLHFVGYECRDGYGAVSSKIEGFDPNTMSGLTETGRVYQLLGLPGINHDAIYTLEGWAKTWGVEVEDATDEFIRQYRINLDHLKALGK